MKYGIEKLRKNDQAYDFYLRATLTFLKAIPDHLLEEYNQKYGLGIQDCERLDLDSFRRRAKNTCNTKACNFVEVFASERGILKSNSEVERLLQLRNVEVHRKRATRYYKIPANATENLRQLTKKQPFVQYLFSMSDFEDIPSVLEGCLENLEAFVAAVRRRAR